MVGSLRRGWAYHHHREQVVPRGKRTVTPKARSCTPSDTALLGCGPQRGLGRATLGSPSTSKTPRMPFMAAPHPPTRLSAAASGLRVASIVQHSLPCERTAVCFHLI